MDIQAHTRQVSHLNYIIHRVKSFSYRDTAVMTAYILLAGGFLIYSSGSGTRTLNAITPWAILTVGIVFLLPIITGRETELLLWALGLALVTWALEVIGVLSGVIFGSYTYGSVLGPTLFGAPPLIGLCWIIVVTGAVTLTERMSSNRVAHALLAGTAAVLFDLVLEPVAVGLGYWSWTSGSVPILNYIGWFVIVALATLSFDLLGARTRERLRLEYLVAPFLMLVGIRIFFL